MKRNDYLRALISATSKKEALGIVESLATKRLIAGGLISEGLSRYWWQGRIHEKVYFNVSAFTAKRNKDRIIKEVEAIHNDETPIIAFFKIEHANPKFLSWIDEQLCSPA